MTRLFSLAALAVAGALVLAACGGSSTSSSSGSASTPSYGAAKPSTSNTSNSSGAASVSTKTSSLGTFLVDAKGRALYLWDADHGSTSTCTGACAQAWPPVTISGTPKASGAVKASLLGTTKRPDGSLEAT